MIGKSGSLSLKNRFLHIRWNVSKPQNEVSEIAKPQLSIKEKAIVDIMTENPYVSIDEIASITRLSDSTIDRTIKSLKIKGVIERKGQKNKSQWIVK